MFGIWLRRLRTQPPFESYILPISCFPIPSDEVARIDTFLRNFCAAAMQRWNLSTEIFLQLEQLIGDGARETFATHGKAWLPETGLGVWVDRDPPQKWTLEEFKSLVPGDKLRPIMFQVFQVSTGQRERIEARSVMLPFGSVLEILTTAGDSYLSRVTPFFKNGITDRSYISFPFYIGLLEGKTMENAALDQLERWFDGMTLYVRESAEDQGILIASSVGLRELFTVLGGSWETDGVTFP